MSSIASRLVGSVLAFFAVLIVIVISIPHLHLASVVENPHLVSVTGDLGKGVSRYFWNYRPLDILGQAIAILLASAGVAALLRGEREGR
ncbi:MAG: hypothetical protein J7L98_02575 [Candidatus Verstraetearchaeota archaeon]|nr:hypothetical protein [Candidatus Verstraetearchaeota archaeon]